MMGEASTGMELVMGRSVPVAVPAGCLMTASEGCEGSLPGDTGFCVECERLVVAWYAKRISNEAMLVLAKPSWFVAEVSKDFRCVLSEHQAQALKCKVYAQMARLNGLRTGLWALNDRPLEELPPLVTDEEVARAFGVGGEASREAVSRYEEVDALRDFGRGGVKDEAENRERRAALYNGMARVQVPDGHAPTVHDANSEDDLELGALAVGCGSFWGVFVAFVLGCAGLLALAAAWTLGVWLHAVRMAGVR